MKNTVARKSAAMLSRSSVQVRLVAAPPSVHSMKMVVFCCSRARAKAAEDPLRVMRTKKILRYSALLMVIDRSLSLKRHKLVFC